MMKFTLLDWSDPLETIDPPFEMPDGGLSLFAAEAARARILLVEDQRDFRELLAELLTAEGYAVDCAANGREACLRLQRAPLPRLILLDLLMPVMNGWGFLSALQPDPALAAIPVILLSAMSASEPMVDRARVVTALTKPFAFEELLALLERHR